MSQLRRVSMMMPLMMVLLAIDGVLCAIVGAFLLPPWVPTYWGSALFVVGAGGCGVVNAVLVWAAMGWAGTGAVNGAGNDVQISAVPLWSWLLTIAVLVWGGPGGDVVFGGTGMSGYSVVVFVVVGLLPPGWLLYRAVHHGRV